MLRSAKDLEGYKVRAMDGELGSVSGFLFDDARWTVRFLVVEVGGVLDAREVLISPISFRRVDWNSRYFELALSVQGIRDSPRVDVHKPVSRQQDVDLHRYYGYPYYWGTGLWGMGSLPSMLASGVLDIEEDERAELPPPDHHLRSVSEVRGYHVLGSDGPIGHIEDFILDDQSWQLRYLLVDTSNWWFGKKVMVSAGWTTNISWPERKVRFELSREAIKACPKWDDSFASQADDAARVFHRFT